MDLSMEWYITSFSILLFIFTGVTVLIGWIAWRRRRAAGSLPLAWLLFAAAEWMLFQSLETAAVGIPLKVTFAKIEYLGITLAPPLLLWFAVEFSRQEKLSLRWRHAVLALIPLLTVLVAATNDWHHLLWTRFTPAPDVNANLVLYEYGIWFWIFVGFDYMLVLAASLLIIRSAVRFRDLYRAQALMVILALPLPWLGNILYIFKLGHPGEDLTPIGFGLAGMILVGSIFRLQLFELAPVARDRVIEWMDDALIVVDRQLRLVDINPAAVRLLAQVQPEQPPESTGGLVGRPARTALVKFPRLIERLAHAQEGRFEFQAQARDQQFEFQGRISPLYDRSKLLVGWVVILHDITDLNRARDDAYQARDQALATAAENSRLYEQMRQMAVTDPLTGLYTRRHFFSLSALAFEQSRIHGQPLCAVMIDLDHYKSINDRFGHATGDRVLQLVARFCLDSLRKMDVVGRYGGDELVVLLPQTHLAQAVQAAERLRARIEAAGLDTGTQPVKITISVGAAECDLRIDTLESLIEHADQALYAAKQTGRNRVKCYNDGAFNDPLEEV
jgi:diguanylate cyclase (GGDEF)-like protein